MDKVKELLNTFYTTHCNEDTRLNLNKHNKIEFITTTTYIDKYLKSNDKILEIGAGTGAYSIYYAAKGYEVTAIEYIEHNLNILKSKITNNMKISANLGNATNLKNIKDNTFDITLVLGPLYHLFTKKEQTKAINEAIRVTKKGGKIFIAYLTSDSIMVNWVINDGRILSRAGIDFDSNYKIKSYPEGLFASFYINEFKNFMKNFDLKFLKNITTDGLNGLLKDKIDLMTDEEFDEWVKYHLSTCEREDLQGYCNHMLYICKK